jgi:putative flippase GtrA
MPDATAYAGWSFRLEVIRILRFALAGAANTTVGLGVVFLVQWKFDTRPALSNTYGFAAGVLVSYVLHHGLAFRDRIAARWTTLRYMASVALSFAFNQIILEVLVRSLPAAGVYIAQGVAVMTYTITLFLLCRFWIFAPMPFSHQGHSFSDVRN